MARGWLFERVGTNAKRAFPFMGVRCDRVVHGVFERLADASRRPLANSVTPAKGGAQFADNLGCRLNGTDASRAFAGIESERFHVAGHACDRRRIVKAINGFSV